MCYRFLSTNFELVSSLDDLLSENASDLAIS